MKRFNSAIDNPNVGNSPSAKIFRGGLHTSATTSGCAPKPSTDGQSPNGGSTIELLLEAARASDHSVPASTHGSCGKGLSPSAISNAQDAGQLGAPSKGYSPTDSVEAVDSSIDSDPEATQIGNTYFAEVAEAKRCIQATSREPTIAPAAAGVEIIPMDAHVSVRDCLAPAAPEETAISSTTTESAIARPETADSRDKNRATEDAVAADTVADSAVAMAESQSSTERSARPCMACRLVRVRCDRKVPCSRCVRLEEPCRPPPYVRRGRPPWRHRGNAQLPTAPLLGRLDVHVSQLPGPNSCISLLPSGSTIHSASIVSPGPGRELYPTFHSTGPDCGRGLYPTFHSSGPDLGSGLYPAFHSAGQAVGAADGLGSHAMPVSAMQLLGSTRSAPIGHLNAPAVAVAHSASPILSAASSEQVSNLAGHGFWPEVPRNGTTIERLGAAQASIPHLAQPHVGGQGIPSRMPVQVGQPLQVRVPMYRALRNAPSGKRARSSLHDYADFTNNLLVGTHESWQQLNASSGTCKRICGCIACQISPIV